MKTTVLHFIHNYSGAKKYSLELMSQCCEFHDFDMYFIYISYQGTYEFEIEKHVNYSLISIPELEQPDNDACFDSRIKAISQHIKFSDKIIIHTNHDIISEEKIRMSPKNIKFVNTVHFIPFNIPNPDYSSKLFNQFDRLICVTDYAQDILKNRLEVKSEKLRLIYNGSSDTIATRSRDEIITKYGFDEDEVLLLYIGRLEETKGIFFFMKVFQNVLRTNSKIRLVIAGNGDYDSLFRNIESGYAKITLLGNVENSEVHNLMRACDIGVIPSLMEQCSYVALEMMSNAMAIVATDVKGMGELFADGYNALTIPVEYIDGVAFFDKPIFEHKLSELIRDRHLRDKLGNIAFQEWQEKYTARRMALETKEVYKSVIES